MSRSSVVNVIAAVSIAVAGLLVGWALFQVNPTTEPGNPPHSRISIAGATSIGSATANLALIEFSDFQCQYCREFALNVLPELKARYVDSGQVLFVLMHVPNPATHPLSLTAAEAAECAGLEGELWKFQYALFSRGLDDPASVERTSQSLGLTNKSDFVRCSKGTMRAKIADQTALAFNLEVAATPTFLLGYVRGEQEVEIVQRFEGARAAVGDAIRLLLSEDR